MRRRAFTLLELTVVVTVAGLLLALAVPPLASLRNQAAVRAAMADLGALFSTARQRAVAERRLVSIVFDRASAVVELRSDGEVLARRTLGVAYGIVLGANRDSVVYDPRGLGYGVSNITVTLRRGGVVDTLTMSRLGRVKW